MNRHIVTVVMAAVLMSSCGVYDRYRPVTEVPENLYGDAYIPSDSSSAAAMGWKELFTDPFLVELIDTALVRNTDLRTARLRVEQAEASLLNARLAYLPSLNASAEGGVSRWDGSDSKTYSLGGGASWEIDIFGRLTASKRAAFASFAEAQAYSRAVQTSLVSSVASSYYTLLMLDEQIRIGRETADSWGRTVSVLKSLKRAGKANEAAVLQAEANKATLEASILSLLKSRNETETAICLLLACPPSRIERGDLSDQSFPEELSAGVPVSLLSNRPDVRQAEMALAKAFYGVGAAKAQFYPSLTLSGSAGWTNNGGGAVVNPAQWLLSSLAALSQPLFNRGGNIANLRKAEAEYEIASLSFRQKLLDAGSEVNKALVALQTARGRMELNVQTVESLEEAVRKTELLMRHSSSNYLEVLTAQQSLLSVRQSLSRDKMDEITAVITLYHALGGGE